MPVTPLGIYSPAGTEGYDLTVDLAAMATSIDSAIGSAETGITSVREIKTYKWANVSERNGQTGMAEGDTGWQNDTNIYYHYTGAAWKAWDSNWITYTSTLTGITLGTGGTSTSRYKYEAGLIVDDWRIIFGTGGSISGGTATRTLPVPASAAEKVAAYGGLRALTGWYEDVSTPTSYGLACIFENSVSVIRIGVVDSNAVSAKFTSANTTVPVAGAVDDAIHARYTYEAA